MKQNQICRTFTICLLLLGLSGLGGCSFQSLHGPTVNNNHLSDEMASIEIAVVDGRVPQRIRNELIFRTTGGNHPHAPRYYLSYAIKSSILSVALRRSGDAGSKIFKLDAKFTLFRDKDKKKKMFQADTSTRAAFDKFDSTFANIRAQQDAENRAAKAIANDIYNRLAIFISGNS